MQDDCYLISADGWKAELTISRQTKTITEWDCDLVPKSLVINRYFLAEKQAIEKLEAEKETIAAEIAELEEEHNTEDGYFAELDKLNKANVLKRLKDLLTVKPKKEKQVLAYAAEPVSAYGEQAVLRKYLKLLDEQTAISKKMKDALSELDKKVIERYKTLTIDEIKQLVVDDKWMTVLERDVKTEMEHISQRLTQRIKELAERYETPLPMQSNEVRRLEAVVYKHLGMMGF